MLSRQFDSITQISQRGCMEIKRFSQGHAPGKWVQSTSPANWSQFSHCPGDAFPCNGCTVQPSMSPAPAHLAVWALIVQGSLNKLLPTNDSSSTSCSSAGHLFLPILRVKLALTGCLALTTKCSSLQWSSYHGRSDAQQLGATVLIWPKWGDSPSKASVPRLA